jgi:hypothetical protein
MVLQEAAIHVGNDRLRTPKLHVETVPALPMVTLRLYGIITGKRLECVQNSSKKPLTCDRHSSLFISRD